MRILLSDSGSLRDVPTPNAQRRNPHFGPRAQYGAPPTTGGGRLLAKNLVKVAISISQLREKHAGLTQFTNGSFMALIGQYTCVRTLYSTRGRSREMADPRSASSSLFGENAIPILSPSTEPRGALCTYNSPRGYRTARSAH